MTFVCVNIKEECVYLENNNINILDKCIKFSMHASVIYFLRIKFVYINEYYIFNACLGINLMSYIMIKWFNLPIIQPRPI